MVVAKRYIYVKAFDGIPKKNDLQIVEETLPELKDGEFLTEAIYLSVDPYMRVYASTLNIGDTMLGTQVGKILESKSSRFPVGKYVVGNFGWRSHAVVSDSFKCDLGWGHPAIVPFEPTPEVPLSLAVGTLGMPGNTAYFGFLEICKPKAGETVVITGAAGAVGSHVGQIAKMKGCTVIGIAGSDQKNQWLKSLGFDHIINYKKQDVAKVLKEVAPKGLDCYFDNVGGELSSIILSQMNTYGRISVSGAISSYNNSEFPKATIVQRYLVNQQLLMCGFIVKQWADRWNEGILQNLKWIQEGKLKFNETITVGFDKMLDALIGVLLGENTGKAVVKV